MIGGCAHYVGVRRKSFVLLIETFATECTVHMETVMSLTQTRTLSLHCRIRSDSANHTVFVCFGVGHPPSATESVDSYRLYRPCHVTKM